jgi:hypothetical protein
MNVDFIILILNRPQNLKLIYLIVLRADNSKGNHLFLPPQKLLTFKLM